MKNFKKLEKILLIFIMIAIVCGLTGNSKATVGDVNSLNMGTIPIIQNNVQPTPTPSPTPTPVPIGNITNNNTNNSSSLPKTGANDTAMWILIVACAIAAVYTYKKVRDYNV